MRASIILIWAITAAAMLLQAANGLLQGLLPMRMHAQGLSDFIVSCVVSAYGLGFAIGCVAAPFFIRHVGHIRAYASLAALVAVLTLMFSQAEAATFWIVLRGLSGLVLAGMFTVADGWISGSVTSSHRGRVLSIYTICTKVALMLSPLAITESSASGPFLFMVASALISLSLLPTSATRADEPRAPGTVHLDVKAMFAIAPSAVVGAFCIGLINSPVVAMAPLYGLQIGLTMEWAARLLFALQAGSLIFQWPLGWLSDRFDRRYVIVALLLGAVASCVLVVILARMDASPFVMLLAFITWGGTAMCIYSVCVAHACDLVPPEKVVPTVSGLLMVWAVGSAIGPIPAGAVMGSVMGANGLFVYSGVVAFACAGFIIWRISLHERHAVPGGFVAVPMSQTLSSAAMDPRAEPVPDDVGEHLAEEPPQNGETIVSAEVPPAEQEKGTPNP